MKINERLKTIGDLVEEGSFCFDVGCDHALLDIYLVKRNLGIKALASDILEGPVQEAKKNISKENLSTEIEVVKGDGLSTYREGIDTIIISGMGGRNMIGIFKRNLGVLRKVSTILLSPNNYQEEVKRFLCHNGFYIDDEIFVKEKKFIYQIIKFKRGKRYYSNKQYFFGPVFLEKKGNLFNEYYEREKKSREIILGLLPKKFHLQRRKHQRKLKLITKVLEEK